MALAAPSCGGDDAVDAPFVFCENQPGTGDQAADILGSWFFIVNAAGSTHTFYRDGRMVTFWGSDTDDPPRNIEARYRVETNRLHIDLDDTAVIYDMEVDRDGYWTVSANGADREWRRCGT